MTETEPVRVPVALYFDYNCAFCYVGNERLQKLARTYPLAVQYRFIEIHPSNSAEGQPLEALGHDEQSLEAMQNTLEQMAEADGIPLAKRTFTTNSRRALLLAQAVFDQRPRNFTALHEAIFRAYFVDQRNIGDPEVLRELADTHGVADLVESAWSDQHYLSRLLEHVEAAQELGLTGVPTLVVGGRPFTGAVSIDTLEEALKRYTEETH